MKSFALLLVLLFVASMHFETSDARKLCIHIILFASNFIPVYLHCVTVCDPRYCKISCITYGRVAGKCVVHYDDVEICVCQGYTEITGFPFTGQFIPGKKD